MLKDLAQERGMDLPHYKTSIHDEDGKDIDTEDYEFDYQEAEDYLQDFCPEGYWCGFEDGDWGVWSVEEDESVQESTKAETDKEHLDTIMNAIYKHTLSLKGGKKVWRGYTLDIEELICARNMMDGWKISVFNQDNDNVGTININN